MIEQADDTRRGTLFGIVLFIANAYLVGFAADGAISVFDDFLGALLGAHVAAIVAVRDLVASLVVLASFLMLIVLVFVPRLPKRVFLPLIAFAIWCALGALPFLWAGASSHAVLVVLAIVEAAIGAGAFLYIKWKTGHWLVTADGLPRRSHAALRITLAALATLLIVPALLASLLVLNVASMIQGQTASYIQFTPAGIDLQETTLRKGDKSVRLIGMLHIGEPRFYQALYASFPKDALVLEEGVTDRQQRLAGNFSYREFARVLGLEQQPRLGASAAPDAVANAKPKPVPAGAPELPAPSSSEASVLRPDVDVSDFSDSTIRFLVKVGEIYQAGSVAQIIARIETVMKSFSAAEIQRFYDDVIHNRNRHLLASFDQEIAGHDTIVIPWGAMHMPEIEQKLKERGFAVQSRQSLPLMRYGTILHRLSARSGT